VSYAETQQEIIRAQLRGRPPVMALPPARVHPFRPAPAPRPAPEARASQTRSTAAPAVLSAAADKADSDLAAAVAAASRLRFAADIEQIAAAAGVTVADVQGSIRTAALVEVRRIIAAYLRQRGCSLPEIGRILHRDHTTVLNLLRLPAKTPGLHEEVAS
jgi:Bacterial dnaA protein helix-turn-helix